jgi:DNA-binding MarR family transcriptional regulator
MELNGLLTMNPKQNESDRVAFLLSQLGARAAQEFTRLLQPLGLAPADAGILRFVARSEGISQQALAAALKMHASRLVALIDDLETRGLLVREVHPSDRRLYSLALTDKGKEILLAIRNVSDEHNRLMCAALTRPETEVLRTLLTKIAQEQGLSAGVHPGYRSVPTKAKKLPARQKTASK